VTSERVVLRITAVPPGEAPLAIREQWVGVALPLAPALRTPRRARTFGVLTGPRRRIARLVARILGKTVSQRGYVVSALPAVETLGLTHPKAAQWWRENTPHLMRRGGFFLFPEDTGQVELTESEPLAGKADRDPT
jgi:hypothetical protein